MKSKLPDFSVSACLLLICVSQGVFAELEPVGKSLYVSVDGNDNNAGSIESPFRTIQKAADTMQPGDTTYIREGSYQESVTLRLSGRQHLPVRFEAYEQERVVIDGTNPLTDQWQPWKENIYKTSVAAAFDQLFRDGLMLTEARWPNRSFPDQLWNQASWASSGEGSRYGKMVDPELESTNIDWTGAIAVLNVAHQFRTWTRKVLVHEKGSDSFRYEKNLHPITSYADKTRQWEDDRYYLVGKLEALDAPGEWYLDREALVLYVFSETYPAKSEFRYKTRDYGFKGQDNAYVELHGIRFFGTTIELLDCSYCVFSDNHLSFPVYSRRFNDPQLSDEPAQTLITGTHNQILNNQIEFAQGNGIEVTGSSNHIEANTVHDVVWSGQGFGIKLTTTGESGNVLSRNTVYNTGYSAVSPRGEGNWKVSYNHIYNTCLAAKDCAAIQTGGWRITGSAIHHNWVHDAYATGNHPGGLKGGLGIRGDDQTRGLSVHHNVVYNCGRDGIIVKGDFNRIYNNTVFDIGSNGLDGNYISIHTEPEPFKPWLTQAPLLKVQNQNSLVFNNAAYNISGDRKRTPLSPSKNVRNNYHGKDLRLHDPVNFDFMPTSNSPLIDAGSNFGELIKTFNGDAPDIGAYEFGRAWKAGAK